MPAIDVVREERELFAPPRTPVLVQVPSFTFTMIGGEGRPGTSATYERALGALFTVAYGLKFAVKRSGGPDRKVAPLEGLWWIDGDRPFAGALDDQWRWTMMIRQPPEADAALFADVVSASERKKPGLPFGRLRAEVFDEGLAAQVLHVGPFAREAPVIAALHAFIADAGYEPAGRHHEIYLNDPARTAPERLRTVLRQPVRRPD